MSKTRTHQEMR